MKDFRFVISEKAEALETRTLVHHAFVPIIRYRNSCCSLNISPMTSLIFVEGDRVARTQENMGGRWAGSGRRRIGMRSHASAGDGRRMRDIKFFNDFLVPFLSKLTKIRTKEY